MENEEHDLSDVSTEYLCEVLKKRHDSIIIVGVMFMDKGRSQPTFSFRGDIYTLYGLSYKAFMEIKIMLDTHASFQLYDADNGDGSDEDDEEGRIDSDM